MIEDEDIMIPSAMLLDELRNFIVTESGLEDQLLAMVVKVEKPDLEQTKEELVSKQNQFMITLDGLETALL